MSTREKAFSAVRWTTFVTISRIVLQTLQLIFLARLISAQDFGLMAMVLSVTTFIQIFSDLGIGYSIIQTRDISQDTLSTLYWINIIIGAALSIFIWMASPLAATFYSEPKLAEPLALAGISFFLLALGQQVKVLAEKRLAFKRIAMVELFSAVTSTVAVVFAAWAGLGVYALVLGILTQTGLNSLLYNLFARDGWWPSLTFRLSESLMHLKSGFLILGTNLATTATLQADVILVGRLQGSESLGFYSVPRELTLKVMLATNPVIARVATPVIAQYRDQKSALKRVFLSSIRMTSSINFPIYAFLAAYSHDVITLMFGEKWLASENLLKVMAIWCIFRSLGTPVGSLMTGTGSNRTSIIQSSLVLAAIIPTVYIGSYFGVLGVAWALSILYLLMTVPIWLFVIRPITSAGFFEYSTQWLLPLGTTALTVGVSFVSTMGIDNYIARLIVGGLVGGVAYLVFSWLLNRPWCFAMVQLLRIKLPRRLQYSQSN